MNIFERDQARGEWGTESIGSKLLLWTMKKLSLRLQVTKDRTYILLVK